MKAALIHKFGGPEVFTIDEVPKPEIRSDQVLIRNAASSINPVEWKHRRGNHRLILGSPFPIILGYDLAGEIIKCGKKTRLFKEGDKVFGHANNKYGGALAEFVVTDEKSLFYAPESIPLTDSAAVPMAGLTALQALRDIGKISENNKILIIGAAGGVGHFALQISKIFKAHVTAVSSGTHADFIKEQNPDNFIDYTKTDILKTKTKYDVIFDAAGIYTYIKCKSLLNKKGRYITTLPRLKVPLHKMVALMNNHRVNTFLRKNNAKDLEQLKVWIDSGKIIIKISKRFPLYKIDEAHRISENYHNQGKVIINIPA